MHITKDQSLAFSIDSFSSTIMSGAPAGTWDPKEVKKGSFKREKTHQLFLQKEQGYPIGGYRQIPGFMFYGGSGHKL